MEALFARLTIHAWTARKYDKAISREVAEMHHAPATVGRYNKRLMERSGIYAKIMATIGEARAYHYKQTLASHLEGWRILTGANFDHYSSGIRSLKNRLSELVTELVDQWPMLIAAERRRLNGMFREQDYPALATMRERFGIELALIPLPNAEQFLTNVPEEIQRNVLDQSERAKEAAIRDLWEKLYHPISRMVERLSQPDAIFRDSLVENLREIVEILPRLNFTNDARLESLIERARSLSAHDPQVLREDAVLRSSVAARASDIANQMAAFMGYQMTGETTGEWMNAA